MRQAFISHTLKFIKQNDSEITAEQIEKLNYGLECLYITITKFALLFLLAIILGILPDFIIILVLFNILRYPAFGFHAGNSFMCFILSTGLFIGLPYFVLHTYISNITIYSMIAFSLISFLLFAPADTEKRPLTNSKKRKTRKIISCLLAVTYTVIILFLKDTIISKYLLIALLLESIAICPITYWLFGQKYANYKKLV